MVRARPRRHRHNRAIAAPILRAERLVIDPELRRRINRRLKRNLVLADVIQIDAVDLKVHRVFAIARRNKRVRSQPAARPPSGFPLVGATTPPGVSTVRSRKCRPFSGSSCTVFWPITSPTVIVLRLQSASRALHLHRLARRGDRQLHVHRDLPGHLQRHLLNRVRAEAGRRRLHLVIARLQRRHHIQGRSVRIDKAIGAGSQGVHGHVRVRQARHRWDR